MEHGARKIRVLVADDSRTALRAVCAYLDFEERFEIVGTASDGVRLRDKAESLQPDLVLTDLSMPQLTGLEAAEQLRKSSPGLRIILFTELSGLSLREECLRRGVDGFVAKSQMPEQLMEEVNRLFPENSRTE